MNRTLHSAAERNIGSFQRRFEWTVAIGSSPTLPTLLLFATAGRVIRTRLPLRTHMHLAVLFAFPDEFFLPCSIGKSKNKFVKKISIELDSKRMFYTTQFLLFLIFDFIIIEWYVSSQLRKISKLLIRDFYARFL